jgi:hypothetical protein
MNRLAGSPTIDAFELARTAAALRGRSGDCPTCAAGRGVAQRPKSVLHYRVQGRLDDARHTRVPSMHRGRARLMLIMSALQPAIRLRAGPKDGCSVSRTMRPELNALPIEDDETDAVIGAVEPMAVLPWIEDEAILSLAVSAASRSTVACRWQAALPTAAQRPSPFAVLDAVARPENRTEAIA